MAVVIIQPIMEEVRQGVRRDNIRREGADLDLGETSTGLPPRRALFVGSVNVKIHGELSHELSTLRN